MYIMKDFEKIGTELAISNVRFCIYSTECRVPHFHFFINEKECCIRIDTPEYHSERNQILSYDELKKLIELLTLKRWEFIIDTWNTYNPDYKVDISIPIPNYYNLSFI